MRRRWFDWRLLSLFPLFWGLLAWWRFRDGRTVEAFLMVGQAIIVALVVIAWAIGSERKPPT